MEATIDSLETLLDQNPQIQIVLELNKCYLRTGNYTSGIHLLLEYEKNFNPEEKSVIRFTIGDNYFFAGKMLEAREEYLKLVSRFPQSQVANDALERLYLIEFARKDTVLLKRLAHAIYLYEIKEFDSADDSLKHLLKTTIGPHAYYYLALLYKSNDDLPQALSALEELNENFPEHKIHKAILLIAQIHLHLDNRKEAQKILEDLIIKEPTSIYAARARQMLK